MRQEMDEQGGRVRLPSMGLGFAGLREMRTGEAARLIATGVPSVSLFQRTRHNTQAGAEASRANKMATRIRRTTIRVMFVTAYSAMVTVALVGQVMAQSWLDRPLTNWNDALATIVRGVSDEETIADLAKRCSLPVRRGTAAERLLADAGWLPYLHVDREIAQRDLEILGGMTGADGMCRPVGFNVFVFVGGTLAGTLSPTLMSSRADGAIGAVRLRPDDTMSAEFARYEDSDAHCCPSSRVNVRYRIDRAGDRPVVTAVSVQRVR